MIFSFVSILSNLSLEERKLLRRFSPDISPLICSPRIYTRCLSPIFVNYHAVTNESVESRCEREIRVNDEDRDDKRAKPYLSRDISETG